MTRWLGLDLLFAWIVKQFLYLIVRTRVQPDNIESLNIDAEKPVCYVLKSESLSDYLVMDRECIAQGLPAPSSGLQVGGFQHKRAALYLSGQGWVWQRKEMIQSQPKKLVNMIKAMELDPTLDVQLVPVSLFWGQAPARENSVFKILFSDNWRVPGLFRKLLMIMIQGRNTVVHFDEPVSLRTAMQEGLSQERTVRKLSRVFRTHFRRLREAVIGPDLSHRRILVNALLGMPNVVAAIEAEASRSGKKNIKKAQATARSYAEEIAADYSHAVIRIYYLVLTWLWNKLYNGVSVTGIDRLKKVATNNEVIYVPCHRSHIDYLLMSYLLFRNRMVPPHIAAGVNLNMPVVGPILRRGGAFFLRRSFKGNRLYTAVFNEYLNMTFDRGFSVEYFIEGGRSRTGRLLAPRPGMLSMTVRSFLRTQRRNFVFVPVHVSYEKVLEAGTYLGELYGKEKQQESIFGILRTLRKIRGTFGQVYVNFGDPIHLNDHLTEIEPDWKKADYNDNKPPPWVSTAVDQLGTQIITEINNAAVINPINLLSLVLLSTPKQAMDEKALATQLDFCLAYLRKSPYSNEVVVPEIDGNGIIAYCDTLEVYIRQKHPLGDVIRFTDEKSLLMTYYRNNIIHVFAVISLVACLVLNNRRLQRAVLYKQIQQLYLFLQSELFIHWKADDIPGVVDQCVAVLVEYGYLIADAEEVWAPDSRTTEFMHLTILANTTHQTLERFFITVEILIKAGSGKLHRSQLENACTMLAQRMSLLHTLSGPEFSDKSLFRNFIQALIKNDIINVGDNGNLVFGDPLLRSYEDAHSLLGEDTRQSIQQIAEMDLEKEIDEASTNKTKEKA
ncbi:glycerol-3-phosphate 1-O-acyltransferase PlsB [Ketobacter sp. MCCC 1A13808]|uniref:glycerol-3-phosphate 1-O-acyltransferase PlsB n=1 Tax=Ketobacter sp. MCCC 1A13808 TaxID=2602738 RepID=UPI0012EBAC01|nr:glycerol-3-phosphate 1-O-acyltransferase PlsB [Ketobacter sp. MCCC 1A13808]MVF12764.1 glycerol-3-phosphate 1-O-acyltransferase PlsB [Ketobacter sp. MCCC 1A13808]